MVYKIGAFLLSVSIAIVVIFSAIVQDTSVIYPLKDFIVEENHLLFPENDIPYKLLNEDNICTLIQDYEEYRIDIKEEAISKDISINDFEDFISVFNNIRNGGIRNYMLYQLMKDIEYITPEIDDDADIVNLVGSINSSSNPYGSSLVEFTYRYGDLVAWISAFCFMLIAIIMIMIYLNDIDKFFL